MRETINVYSLYSLGKNLIKYPWLPTDRHLNVIDDRTAHDL